MIPKWSEKLGVKASWATRRLFCMKHAIFGLCAAADYDRNSERRRSLYVRVLFLESQSLLSVFNEHLSSVEALYILQERERKKEKTTLAIRHDGSATAMDKKTSVRYRPCEI